MNGNEIAISVNNIGKAYRIGLKEKRYENFVSAVANAIAQPFRNFKKISSLKISRSLEEHDIFWANRHITFEVKQGEVLGIIGKNGAGKSTLLKILSRITEPTEGTAEIFGRVASLLEVGTGFNPELTGRENIFLNGTILGLSKKEIQQRFDSIVDFSGIKTFLDTAIKKYSSGMKVRLAFAVAAHIEPEILIIDEVLAVGDAEFQKKCLGKMHDITANEGRTILFISHDMAAIKNLCTRAILLQAGRIVKEGSPDDVIDHYLSSNTELKNNSSNLLTRKRVKGDGRFIATSYSILDERRKPIKITESGKNTTIALNYEVKENGPDPIVLLIFKNAMEQTIFTCLSRNSYSKIMNLSKAGTIFCEIPRLPLQAGEYRVDVVFKYGRDITDALENAFILTVEKGDFFGTGKINDNMMNGLFVYHTWKVE